MILWDSLNFGAIYKSNEFVIVPPESVISVVTIKSNLTKKDLIDGLSNLSSIIDLDLNYRTLRVDHEGELIFKPIYKFFLSFKASTKKQDSLRIISDFYKDLLSKHPHYEEELINVLKETDPFNPNRKTDNTIKCIFVSMITSLESKEKSFLQGLGPPDDILGRHTFKHGIKRVPFLYNQRNVITNQFEKFTYQILLSVYGYYETKAYSTLASWSDLNPLYGSRIGDSAEINEEEGIELMNYR